MERIKMSEEMEFTVVDFEEKEDGSMWVRLDLFEHLQALFDKLCGK